MGEIIKILSTYNIFTNLLPGVLFITLINELSVYNFSSEDILKQSIIFYFVGLIINRIGSIVVEPFLKKINLLKFTDYSKYISVSKKDSKLVTLSEVNNMYRSLTAVFFAFTLIKFYEFFNANIFDIPKTFTVICTYIIVFYLVIFSYIKQTKYIAKRVNTHLESRDN